MLIVTELEAPDDMTAVDAAALANIPAQRSPAKRNTPGWMERDLMGLSGTQRDDGLDACPDCGADQDPAFPERHESFCPELDACLDCGALVGRGMPHLAHCPSDYTPIVTVTLPDDDYSGETISGPPGIPT